MKTLLLLGVASILFIISNVTLAEDIKIPVGSQAAELQQIAKPTTGMTKSQVKSQFGEPQKENPAKGKPPISSWEYAEFEVYFENDHVIHSVLKPKLHENKEILINTTDEISEDELKGIKSKK